MCISVEHELIADDTFVVETQRGKEALSSLEVSRVFEICRAP